MDLEGKIVLPDRLQGVVSDGLQLLATEVRMGARRWFPYFGARACHQNCLGRQTMVITHGLHYGEWEAKRRVDGGDKVQDLGTESGFETLIHETRNALLDELGADC